MRMKLYTYINCCFLQVHRQINEEVSGLHHYYTYAEKLFSEHVLCISYTYTR